MITGILLVLALSSCSLLPANPDADRPDDNTSEDRNAGNTATYPGDPESISPETGTSETVMPETGEYQMQETLFLLIGGTEVSVEWENNESVKALAGLAAAGSITVQMSRYGGFEQVGPLGTSLPRNDVMTDTEAGDIVLYSGDQIVIFYGSNSWAYTRLGRITDKNAVQMKELLGQDDVAITITYGS